MRNKSDLVGVLCGYKLCSSRMCPLKIGGNCKARDQYRHVNQPELIRYIIYTYISNPDFKKRVNNIHGSLRDAIGETIEYE